MDFSQYVHPAFRREAPVICRDALEHAVTYELDEDLVAVSLGCSLSWARLYMREEQARRLAEDDVRRLEFLEELDPALIQPVTIQASTNDGL